MLQQWIKQILVGLLILALVPHPLLAGPTPQRVRLATGSEYVAGEVLVRFRPGVTPQITANGVQITGDAVVAAELNTVLAHYEVLAVTPLFADAPSTAQGLERIYKLQLAPTADLLTLLADLSSQEAVEYAEPNYIYHTQGYRDGADPEALAEAPLQAAATLTDTERIPADRLFAYEWGLHNPAGFDINAPAAWSVFTGTNSILVAVIDSGVDYQHEDLDDGRVRTDLDKDYVNRDDEALDDNGHGTHVAGTIAAETNNGVGVAGILWQAQILPLKVCNEGGSCNLDHIVNAIRYAADKGARVINMSLGSGDCSDTLEAAIDYAYFEKGVVIVAAAGNENSSVGYPAKYEPVLAVGALDRHGKRAFFSNTGDQLDLAAPGVRIFSTLPGQTYDTFSGTSMASPHVAGVAALVLAQRPELTPHQVRALLLQSATDLGESGLDRYYGYGLVNAHQALAALTPTNVSPPGPARCISEDCGASATVIGEPDALDLLRTLRAVRDFAFTQEPGAGWTQVYDSHRTEVFWRVLADAELRSAALQAMRSLHPLLQELLTAKKPATVVTQAMVRQTEAVINELAQQGSPALSADLLREWQRLNPARFVGQDVHTAWAQLTHEAAANTLYFPLIQP